MLLQQVLDQFVVQKMVDWRASAAGENKRGIMCHPDGPDQRNRMKSKKKHRKRKKYDKVFTSQLFTFLFHRS